MILAKLKRVHRQKQRVIKKKNNIISEDIDPTAADRKQDHISLAGVSQIGFSDPRFFYEPMLSGHPQDELEPVSFLGKTLKAPIWISSMTGGTELARKINHNLALACAEFGIGMGLGSCRSLLYSNERIADFDFRKVVGPHLPFYGNIGIAQLEELQESKETERLQELVEKLQIDGMIIHVNPLQEWLQPEGDRIKRAPVDSITELLDQVEFPVIVKEVGQGMGPESIAALLRLPLTAIDFAAHGGTNFAKVELLRSQEEVQDTYPQIAPLGHSATQMVDFVNTMLDRLGEAAICKQIIISGGVKDFLDGYYLMNMLNCSSIYGQGYPFLIRAKESYEALRQYLDSQIEGLKLAKAFLHINEQQA